MPAAHSPRRRVVLLAAGLLVPTLVPVVVAGALAVRAAGREQSALAQREASAAAARLAGRIDQTLHERATALRLTASSSMIAEVYRHPYRAESLQPWVDAELTRVRSLDPDLTTELCLLDADGTPRAELVRGRTQTITLPDDRVEPVWQAASLALRPGQVHQQRPYVSPDTGTWVVSTSVPVVVNKRPVAVLHSEIGLEPLRTRLLARSSSVRARVVDPADGTVVMDSAAVTPAPAPGTDLLTQWLPRARPLVEDPARDGDLVRTATTANGWQVEVLAEPARGVPARLLGVLAALVALTVTGCAVLAHRLVRRPTVPPIETPFQASEIRAEGALVPAPREAEWSALLAPATQDDEQRDHDDAEPESEQTEQTEHAEAAGTAH